ncbi:MAG: hypothetical protein Q7R56_03290, partial [Nanoarchaeota archaeon]|nr:hypothetical protein [Nanoarchaeota archaeon]
MERKRSKDMLILQEPGSKWDHFGTFFLLILLFIIFVIIGWFFIPSFQKIISNNFNNELRLGISLWIFILIVFISMTYSLRINFVKDYQRNNFFWNTVMIMFVLFCIGIVFIDYELGNKPLELYLMEPPDYKSTFSVMTCKGPSIAPVIGEKLECKIKKDIKNIQGNLSINYKDRGNNISPFSNEITFEAQENITYLLFNLQGEYRDEIKYLSVGFSPTFITNQEYRENRKDFLGYLFALFGIIIFSIPAAAINFKKMIKPKKT